MSRKNHVIQLVPLTYKTSSDIDTIEEGTPRQVLAEKKSVNRMEFYPAMANGLRPELSFVLWSVEYHNEPRLFYNGTMYEVIRTHSQDEQHIELVCQPLEWVQTGLSRLRDVVEIWYNDLSQQNSMGEQKPTPEKLFTLPAQIIYEGGGTTDVHGVIQTHNVAKVMLKYRTGITSAMFVKIQGQRWDIRYIEDPYHRHETLILTVERVVL